MKISQIVCVYPPYGGGIGKVVFHQSNKLAEFGHDVVVFTPEYKKNKNLNNNNFKVKVIKLKTLIKFGNSAFLPQLFWKLKNFDVVILHYPFFGVSEIVWLAKKFGLIKKLVIFYHMDFVAKNLFFKIFSLPSKIILKSLLRQSHKILVSSFDYVKESQIADYFKKNQNKFIEVPFGVEKVEKIEFDNNKEEKFILFVGGLDKAHCFKGVPVLLNAFRKLDNNILLKIVGNGDLKSEYEKLADELKISDKVKFLEKVSDEELNKLYSNCEFLVLPSINSGEAFGLVLVEAMAHKKAIIASDLPGVRSVCQNGINGLLVKPGDAFDLAEKMKILLGDKDLLDKFGKAGRCMVEEKFNWKTHTEKLREIIYV